MMVFIFERGDEEFYLEYRDKGEIRVIVRCKCPCCGGVKDTYIMSVEDFLEEYGNVVKQPNVFRKFVDELVGKVVRELC